MRVLQGLTRFMTGRFLKGLIGFFVGRGFLGFMRVSFFMALGVYVRFSFIGLLVIGPSLSF